MELIVGSGKTGGNTEYSSAVKILRRQRKQTFLHHRPTPCQRLAVLLVDECVDVDGRASAKHLCAHIVPTSNLHLHCCYVCPYDHGAVTNVTLMQSRGSVPHRRVSFRSDGSGVGTYTCRDMFNLTQHVYIC